MEYVGYIYASADTLLTLTNDILDFSKLETGKMKILMIPIPMNLKGTIHEAVP